MNSYRLFFRLLVNQPESKGTVNWCTNVGNEFGQVLNSVFTANEGQGLQKMISGIVKR